MVRSLAILMICALVADAQSAEDEPVNLVGKQQLQAIAPYVAKARATYPSAKRRYLAGLPPGYSFAVRKHLTEPSTHRMEGVYVNVTAIKGDKISGRIANDVKLPSFQRGQHISFPESELEDWVIFHPDGTKEGDVVAKFLKKARSSYTNDLAFSSREVATIKQVCHQVIGLAFRDAALWRGVQPFIRNESDFYQPITACRNQYCSGGLRLRDGTDLLYTYLHIDENSTDLTPDAGRKGNNRIVGVSLIRHGKTILSEGHVDRQTVGFYLRDRNSSKHN